MSQSDAALTDESLGPLPSINPAPVGAEPLADHLMWWTGANNRYAIINLAFGNIALKEKDDSGKDGTLVVGFERTVYEPAQWDATYYPRLKAYSFRNVASGKFLSVDWSRFSVRRRFLTLMVSSAEDLFKLRKGTRNAAYFISPLRLESYVVELRGNNFLGDTNVILVNRNNIDPGNHNQQWTFGKIFPEEEL